MITRPLDLQSKLSAPPRETDALFWLNAGMVVLFFTFFGSQFILLPGEGVDLKRFVLPETSSQGKGTASVVVSYRRDKMILFEGGIYEPRELLGPMEKYAKLHPGATMLVRVDKQVSVQGLLDLFDLAKQAGFARALVAAEQRTDDSTPRAMPVH